MGNGLLPQPRIWLIFQSNVSWKKNSGGNAKNFSGVPPLWHYQVTDSNLLFQNTLMKPNSIWFLTIETAMLQIYPKVYQTALRKEVFPAFTMQDTN